MQQYVVCEDEKLFTLSHFAFLQLEEYMYRETAIFHFLGIKLRSLKCDKVVEYEETSHHLVEEEK